MENPLQIPIVESSLTILVRVESTGESLTSSWAIIQLTDVLLTKIHRLKTAFQALEPEETNLFEFRSRDYSVDYLSEAFGGDRLSDEAEEALEKIDENVQWLYVENSWIESHNDHFPFLSLDWSHLVIRKNEFLFRAEPKHERGTLQTLPITYESLDHLLVSYKERPPKAQKILELDVYDDKSEKVRMYGFRDSVTNGLFMLDQEFVEGTLDNDDTIISPYTDKPTLLGE